MNKNLLRVMILTLVLPVFVFVACESDEDHPDYILNVDSLKDKFADYFMIGNVMNPDAVSSAKLKRHFNVLTAENNMKPSYIAPTSIGTYSYGTADSMVNSARSAGFKVVGHTLLWHSQIPAWQQNVTADNAKNYMERYISDVVGHFKGRIYSWDVLNEAFPDGGFTGDWKTSMRSNNPWYRTLGSDFVYYGFVAARRADSGALLYYNDYNMNDSNKAAMVRDMVRDVNARYKNETGSTRLLIEGIGMQGHHNTGVTAQSIRNSINLFRPLGVKISISELDVLSQTWNQYSSNAALTSEGKNRAAELYKEYFTVFIENKDIIERVTFWGVNDEQSWRARAQPLIFANDRAKSSFKKIMELVD